MQAKLLFDSIVLNVNVVNFKTSYPISEGTFTVSTLDNPINDVQICLGSPFNIQPILNTGEQNKILITSVTWSSEYRGHVKGLLYYCGFVTNVKIDQGNILIWDFDNNDNFQDVQDIVGNADLDTLSTQAIDLIEKYRNYKPNVDVPYPSAKGEIEDDIAAVLANTKPAAIINEYYLTKPIVALLLKEAWMRGFYIETTENFGTKYSNLHTVIVGERYNVIQIAEIINQSVRYDEVSEYYYLKIGMLLGHPEETLLAKPVKDFGFNSI